MEELTLQVLGMEGNVLTILEGKALDQKALPKLSITGHPGTVIEFIQKNPELIVTSSYVTVNKIKRTICLFINPYGGEYQRTGTVKSVLLMSTEIGLLGFNQKEWRPKELSRFLRLHKHYAVDKDTAHLEEVIEQLSNFEATIEKTVENKGDNRANREISQRQAVTSNIPKAIKLFIPLFLGGSSFRFDVEVDIDPDTLDCILVVPDLDHMIEEETETAMQEEIDRIRNDETGATIALVFEG